VSGLTPELAEEFVKAPRRDVQDAATRAREAIDVRAFAELLAVALAAQLAPLISLRGQADGPEDDWRLLGLNEAAARLGRSTRWVRDRVKAGELPCVRLDGGAFAFELADLQAFAKARRVALEEPAALAARLQAAHEPASTQGSRNGHRVDDRRVRT
jgi:excisionase family DNA binding protein